MGQTQNYLPRHIAVIMDGNGRWAEKRFMPRLFGHKAGVEALRSVISRCSLLGIEVLSLYAFSTENWKRPSDEVSGLMDLLVQFLQKEIAELHRNGVRILCLGDLSGLPGRAQEEVKKAEVLTASNSGLVVNIALNYGGRDEIVKAAKILAASAVSGEIEPDAIDAEAFEKHLYTAGQPDPDLMIRTSGEQRISNFLLWQLAYTEFYFTDVLWPDFNDAELDKALEVYARRHRRFGKL
jgi:undecaprenyl diphosphate synthase